MIRFPKGRENCYLKSKNLLKNSIHFHPNKLEQSALPSNLKLRDFREKQKVLLRIKLIRKLTIFV